MVKLTLDNAELMSESAKKNSEFVVYASLVSDNYQELLSLKSPIHQAEKINGADITLLNGIGGSPKDRLPNIKLVGYCSFELTTGSVLFILVIIGERKEVLSLQDEVFEVEIDPDQVRYINARELLSR